jgi:mRNA interferase MazF
LSASPQERQKIVRLYISPKSYNRRVGLAVVGPVTSRAKGHPFEVPWRDGLSIEGVVLSDHVKILDWCARNATRIQSAPQLALDAQREHSDGFTEAEHPPDRNAQPPPLNVRHSAAARS